ncbi:glycosyltransferase family 4 protein [Microbulbifer elongatus]|uniref:Glycosyltransferase family 4 protein n=1 Tax=Microbulbifer elongatus TaxID=86173 RepID=A0ABT1P517_9GAMM|nr:glycosyltransferase family 4 protein [Microbulbifer elongatus]MCQ3830627.1 glycosyltransferase family 4 protein [Microbulbifer elongatus]
MNPSNPLVAEKRNTSCPLVFLINVDWYFLLHWRERALSARDNGWDVWVITCITDAKFRVEMESLGFNVVDVPISRHSINPLVELKVFRAVARALQSVNPAILHSVTIKPICYSLLINKVSRFPVVLSFPGLGILRSESKVSRCVWWFLRTLLGKKYVNTSVSATFENHDDRSFTQDKGLLFSHSEVVPGAGVNLQRYPLLDQKKEGVEVRVLFASRLLRSKGIAKLVNAVGQLVEEGYPIRLVVAGIADYSHSDGLQESELKIIRSKFYVDWLGQVDDMLPVFEDCDVVCLPTSYGEGIPRVLIEGAACGRPLVATDVPGCRDIINQGKNGFIVPVEDQHSLVDALKILVVDSKLRNDFGIAGRAYVESNFSDQVVVSQVLSLYQRIIMKSI